MLYSLAYVRSPAAQKHSRLFCSCCGHNINMVRKLDGSLYKKEVVATGTAVSADWLAFCHLKLRYIVRKKQTHARWIIRI